MTVFLSLWGNGAYLAAGGIVVKDHTCALFVHLSLCEISGDILGGGMSWIKMSHNV